MKWVSPAGPPPWTGPKRPGKVEPLPGPCAAQTAFYLRRMAAQLATHLNVKFTLGGEIARPSLQPLANTGACSGKMVQTTRHHGTSTGMTSTNSKRRAGRTG